MPNSGSSDRFLTPPSYPYSKSGIAPFQTRFNSTEEKDPFLNLSSSFLPFSNAPPFPYPSPSTTTTTPYSASQFSRPLRSPRPLAQSGSLPPQQPPTVKKAAPKPLNNVVDISKVDAGEDPRTYIMLRNLPNRYRLDQVSAVLERAVGDNFTIVSMPVDPQTSRNLGYCFVQFASTADVAKAYRAVSLSGEIKSSCRTSRGRTRRAAKSASFVTRESRGGAKRRTRKAASRDPVLCP